MTTISYRNAQEAGEAIDVLLSQADRQYTDELGRTFDDYPSAWTHDRIVKLATLGLWAYRLLDRMLKVSSRIPSYDCLAKELHALAEADDDRKEIGGIGLILNIKTGLGEASVTLSEDELPTLSSGTRIKATVVEAFYALCKNEKYRDVALCYLIIFSKNHKEGERIAQIIYEGNGSESDIMALGHLTKIHPMSFGCERCKELVDFALEHGGMNWLENGFPRVFCKPDLARIALRTVYEHMLESGGKDMQKYSSIVLSIPSIHLLPHMCWLLDSLSAKKDPKMIEFVLERFYTSVCINAWRLMAFAKAHQTLKEIKLRLVQLQQNYSSSEEICTKIDEIQRYVDVSLGNPPTLPKQDLEQLKDVFS